MFMSAYSAMVLRQMKSDVLSISNASIQPFPQLHAKCLFYDWTVRILDVPKTPFERVRAADHAVKIAMPFIGDLVTPIWATSSGRQPKDVEFAKQLRREQERKARELCAANDETR